MAMETFGGKTLAKGTLNSYVCVYILVRIGQSINLVIIFAEFLISFG